MQHDVLIRDCLAVSSGTLATLTGQRDGLDALQSAWVLWVANQERAFSTWMDAWRAWREFCGMPVQVAR